MSDLEIIRILSEYSDQFQTFDLITYLLRSLGWLLVKLLYFLLEAVEGLLDTAYTMFGLLSYPPIQQFINTFKPAIYLLFIGSIMMPVSYTHLDPAESELSLWGDRPGFPYG